MDRHILAEHIAVTQDQLRGRALEFQILGVQAHGGVGIEHALAADLRVRTHHRVTLEHRARAKAAGAFHHAERADHDAFAQLHILGDDGGGMDAHGASASLRSWSMDMNSASATF